MNEGLVGIHQAYARPADYGKLQALLVTILERKGPPCYGTPGDLDWWYGRIEDPDFLSTVGVWRKGDQIVAFAWPTRGWPTDYFIDFFAHPDFPQLLPELITFGEAWCLREGGGQFGVWTFDGDEERMSLFLSRGYIVERGYGGCLLCALDREPIVPQLPTGFSVGAVSDADVPSRVRAQQSAFNSTLTVAQYERVRRLPAYRSNLDIGVKSPEGEVVAFCIVWLDEHNSYAVFEPVGCHKDYQRRGLGKIAVREGLHRLWAMGVKTASVLGALPGAPAGYLYQSAGFKVLDELSVYTKMLKP